LEEMKLFQMNDTGQRLPNEIKSSRRVVPMIVVLTIAPEPEHNAGYDADFFADNDTGGFGDADETFADAREHFSPEQEIVRPFQKEVQSDEFGTLLRARRARPTTLTTPKPQRRWM
jgi:hypothetical protein